MRHKCRICFRPKPRKSISQLNITENGVLQPYKDVIMFCLGIQISNDPNTNRKLCVKCYRKVIEFYNFKVLAIKNDEFMSKASLPQNGIFLFENVVKIERQSEDSNSEDLDALDEPLVKDKDCDAYVDSTAVNCVLKEKDQSDDEVLSVIKNLKDQEHFKNVDEVNKKKNREKTNIPTGPGVCDQCGQEFKDLRLHMKRHFPRPELKCGLCDKVFLSNRYRLRHVQRKHLAVKQNCKLCGKSVANLKMHMQSIHNKESLPYECVHCHMKFLTTTRLKYHLSIHTKDRPFECEICGRCFRQKLSLSNHKREVHDRERTHLCQFCSKSFFKKYHLQIHLRSHTNEKPYECPECGKFLQTSTSLKIHRLRHKNVKDVSCTMCDATFISKGDLGIHMVSHYKTKRFPCQYCDAKFHRSDHRKRHEYTAHLKHAAVAADAAAAIIATCVANAAADNSPLQITPSTHLAEKPFPSAPERHSPVEDFIPGPSGVQLSAPGPSSVEVPINVG